MQRKGRWVMARTELDRQIEEGAEQLAVFVGRFVSGAPMGDRPRAPGGMPRAVHALLRLAVVAWAGWGAWMWWGLHEHQQVIRAAVVTVCVALPLAVIFAVRGRKRRRHMRSLVLPMALAMKDMLPAWDDHQRLRALTVPLDRSFVKVRLPDGWHGQDGHKDMLRELVQDRMGGRWSGEWNLKSYPFSVVFTPQKPRPKLEPPESIDFFDPAVQQAIEKCKPGQLVLGIDERQQPVFKSMTGETAMWALSVGSGGGKSSFLQMIITQLVGQGATVVGIDVKMASIICFEGVPGVHLYTDPGNVGDMRSAIKWVAREVEARNYVKKNDPNKNFDRLTLILEEGNEFGDASKAYWNDTKEKGDPAGDPIWGDIASVMRMGRHVNVTIIGVFQDLREAAVGSRGLRNMFRLILMGNYNANQWKMIVNTTPVPESVDRAGRMMIIEGNRRIWIQVPYADADAFREHSLTLRRERGYSTEDLYGMPPSASPQRLPSLLQVSTPLLAKESSPALEAAGGGSVTLVKDEDGGQEDAELGEDLDEVADEEDLEDDAPAQELLALAEISRRLAEEEIEVSAELMRQHKRRRSDFPVGEVVDGRELFTYEAIAGYYRPDDTD